MHPAAQNALDAGKDIKGQIRRHRTTLVAAGVAFYGFLALIPTLIAVVSVYGLVANPRDVRRQVESIAAALPEEVRSFLEFQLRSITQSNSAGVSITLVISLAIALWSASGGMAAMISGLRIIHRQKEPMGFVERRGTALLATLGAIVVISVVVFLITTFPALIDNVLGSTATVLFGLLRWVALAVLMVASIGALYRIAVGRPARWWGIITPGTLLASVLWLVLSIVFSVYTENYASYAETYGSLAAVVVVLLWLWLSALVVLIGAELDARQVNSDDAELEAFRGSPEPTSGEDPFEDTSGDQRDQRSRDDRGARVDQADQVEHANR